MKAEFGGELGKTIGRFIDYLRLERGCSENTQRAYASDLKIWAAYCREERRDPLDLREDAVARFLRAKLAEERKKSTVQRMGAMLRSFARFLQYDGVTDNLPRLAPLPSREKTLPQIMTEGEIQRIMNACEDGTPLGKRDRAFIELAYGAGMRASELCNIRLRDLDSSNEILYARGKGDKERTIPYIGAVRRLIEEYISDYRPQLDKRGEEWLSSSPAAAGGCTARLSGRYCTSAESRPASRGSACIRTCCAIPLRRTFCATAWISGRCRRYLDTAP